jgi:hypothetical protein
MAAAASDFSIGTRFRFVMYLSLASAHYSFAADGSFDHCFSEIKAERTSVLDPSANGRKARWRTDRWQFAP